MTCPNPRCKSTDLYRITTERRRVRVCCYACARNWWSRADAACALPTTEERRAGTRAKPVPARTWTDGRARAAGDA